MRSTPIAIIGADLSLKDFRKACRADVELTHSNQTSNDVVYIYNLAIKTLLEFSNHENRARLAYQLCAKEVGKLKPQENPFGTQNLSDWL